MRQKLARYLAGLAYRLDPKPFYDPWVKLPPLDDAAIGRMVRTQCGFAWRCELRDMEKIERVLGKQDDYPTLSEMIDRLIAKLRELQKNEKK